MSNKAIKEYKIPNSLEVTVMRALNTIDWTCEIKSNCVNPYNFCSESRKYKLKDNNQ